MIINEYCNFKCPYCKGLGKQVFAGRKRKELTIQEIVDYINFWCEGQPLKNIRFSGGEPTYHKWITSAVLCARDKGIERIAISTNGSNTYEKYSELVVSGCNDFSISLDAADSVTGDKMAGNIPGAWDKVVTNIRHLSERVYVTVGVVLELGNIDRFIDIVNLASSLGVADIRVISSAQWNQPLPELDSIDKTILDKHPILKYRVNNFISGKRIRGLIDGDSTSCPLVFDDSVIAGGDHYPCVIYMREQGQPIGRVGAGMREERIAWHDRTNTHDDPICKRNCLDVCVDFNRKASKA